MFKIYLKTAFEEDQIVKSAFLDFGKLPVLWFKFPKSVQNDLTDRSDPFVHALIFPMMETGGEFQIEGKVSRSVMDNIVMFNRIWHEWCPEKYKIIKINADVVDDDYRPHNKKMITAFSGGLDAAYTAYKYKKGLDDYYKFDLDKSVMLLGADIPLKNREQFNIAFENAKKMTDDLGIQLIPIETNYRQGNSDWSYCFGSVIMASLEFFSKNYCYGAAASDDSIHHFQTPWGTNPITDQYLTSHTFRFISDGYEHSRTDRANMIKNWETGLKFLRVCWRNEDKSKNCGICEKCVRTKLNFMAVGVHHLPSMPNDLTENELLNENLIQISHNILYFSEIYAYSLKNHTLSAYWRKLLKKQLEIWEKKFPEKNNIIKRKHHSFWWHIKNRRF